MPYIKEIKNEKEKINIDDVQNYCLNNADENLTLEYKSGLIQKKNKEEFKLDLSIIVSSFLNSQGGLLIIGFDENLKKLIPVRNNSFITKEFIDQVIHSSIYPRNHTINLYPIKYDEGRIFIIDIEAGDNTPYMAKDNRYYNRKSTGKVIMEGYEVNDHFHKRKVAIFELIPSIIHYNPGISTLRLQLSAVNLGNGFSRDFYLYMIIDNLINLQNDSRPNVHNRKINEYDFVEINIYTSAPNSAPIFPNSYMAFPLNFYDLKIVDPKRKIGAVYSIYSENSQPTTWKFEIVYNKKKKSYDIKNHEKISLLY